MGFAPKGLLVAPTGETIVARFLRLFRDMGVPVVLVGADPAYAGYDAPVVEDHPGAEGPLAGLLALLEYAGGGAVIAVACDMPFVSSELLLRLIDAPSPAPIVAARRRGRWEPFLARYDVVRVLDVARARAVNGNHGLQGLLDSCGAAELPLTLDAEAELDDWDDPSDFVAPR